ncbi:MAG TPA: Phenylacetic acid catabolic protein [Candidatus Binataceae bacterium]|nr:Phenylacetic acid catabolic protein [Candidatus Binataceae bacterium]
MPARREYSPRSLGVADLDSGRVESHYRRILTRLLAAHAMAEKLTALGYQRALETVDNPELRPIIEKNFREERKHARLIYHALAELGLTEKQADRSMITVVKAPSFEAPMYFAQDAEGELDLLMASIALDVTGLIMIGVNYRDSSYAPHAAAADIILEEEADHDVFATEQLGHAVERFGPDRVNAALCEWLPRAVNFFGPPGSGFTYDCLRYGLKTSDNQELADLFLAMIEKRCHQLGLDLPELTKDYPHALA